MANVRSLRPLKNPGGISKHCLCLGVLMSYREFWSVFFLFLYPEASFGLLTKSNYGWLRQTGAWLCLDKSPRLRQIKAVFLKLILGAWIPRRYTDRQVDWLNVFLQLLCSRVLVLPHFWSLHYWFFLVCLILLWNSLYCINCNQHKGDLTC